MRLGFTGLGRMGFPMVERLVQHGFKVVAHNRSPEKVDAAAKKGAIPAYGLKEMVAKLPSPRIVWLMLPGGKVTDDAVAEMQKLLSKGDIVINGANDFYKYAQNHAKKLGKKGIHYFDCGVSGGVWGMKKGYTLMIGGPKRQFRKIEPLFRALAPKNGYGYFGDVGAGHYVKSIHNIIEYVYLEGIAEGIELLDAWEQPIDLKKAVSVWRPASVINSWLLDLTDTALNRPDFKDIGTEIGSVTIKELEQTVNAVHGFVPAFDAATKMRRDRSRKFQLGKRVIAAVRREFGGHAVKK